MGAARLLLAAAAAAVAVGHQCIHDEVMEQISKARPHHVRHNETRSPQKYAPFHDHQGRMLQGLSYNNIRIYVDSSSLDAGADPFACSYAGQQIPLTLAQTSTDKYTCSAADVLDDAKRAYIRNTIIPAALDYLQTTLSVIPVQGNLQLPNVWPDNPYCDGTGYGYYNRFLCCQSWFPTQWATQGVPNADFLLMLSGRPTTGSLLAWALECQSDQIGRPIAGHANLSPARVSTSASELQYQLSVFIHEVQHALGFSWSKLPSFRVPGTTNQVSSMDQVVSTYYDSTLGKMVYRVTTPKVVAAAKAQYNCYNWPNAGLELEDGGGSGTARSHWEKRLAMYEIMNGVSERVMYKSALTMSFFDDSGWYSVNYARAEALPWGNGEGCSFVTQKCNQWDSRYFCQTAQDQGCTSDMRFGAQCTYQEDQISRPAQFQYFSTAFKGGVQSISDYCPYYQGYTNKDCQDPATTYYFFFYGEAVGAGSRCFRGDFQLRSISSSRSMHSACLQTQCDRTTNLIKITLVSNPPTVVLCPRAGGVIDLNTVSGSAFVGNLYCPRADVLCSGGACAMNDCGGHGTCNPADGTCVCQSGYYGSNNYTCDLRSCPTSVQGVDCSGNGHCNSATGICEDGNGIPGCYAGWKSSDCSVRGCPAFQSAACPSGGTCECSGVGSCNNGTCSCNAGFVGSGCQYTDCPKTNGTRCGGDSQGTCDLTSGLCTCTEGFDANAAPYYYDGAACETQHNGTRPFTPLYYMGTIDPATNASATSINGTLAVKQYTYFTFDATSTDYSLQLVLHVNGTGATPPRLVASYATAGKPTVAQADFVSSATTSGGAIQKIEFVPPTGTTITRFSRTGTILVAAVSSTAQDYSLALTRDGCSALRCVFGTCHDGVCQCDQGWSGVLCDSPDCPGTPDCGNRGSCDTAASYTVAGAPIRNVAPVCNCTSFFTGSQCENIENDGHSNTAPSLQFPAFLSSIAPGVSAGSSGSAMIVVDRNSNTAVANSSSSGLLDIGTFATVAIVDPKQLSNYMNGSIGIYMRMTYPAADGADGIMLAMENNQPSIDLVGSAPIDFDVVAWRRTAGTQEFVHRMASVDGSSVYIGRVFNGRYADARLAYDFYMEIANGMCPPALDGCSGNGQCDSSAYTCVCNPGFRGLKCEIPVPELPLGTTTIPTLDQGAWQYYTFTLQASDYHVELVFTSPNVYARPIVAAALDTRSTSSSLEIVTSEAAQFDFQGVSNGAGNGTNLHTQRLLLKRRTSDVVVVVGVHNAVSAKASLTGSLEVLRHATSQTPVCAGDEACMAAACHGHGVYTTDPLGCRCDPGWSDVSNCASPSFSSLSKLLTAAQEVGSLCSLCSMTRSYAQGDVHIVSVPQTLQKSTALKLTLKNSVVNATQMDSNTTGIPALLVAERLPRSVLDFLLIASNSLPNQTVTLGPSSSGTYYAAVYAQTSGRFDIEASRQTQKVTAPESPSFASQLSEWMLQTTQGRIVIGVSTALLVLILTGCLIQCSTARSLDERIAATEKAAKDETTAYVDSVLKLSGAIEKHGDKAFSDKPALKRMASVAHSIRRVNTGAMSKSLSSAPSQRVMMTPRTSAGPLGMSSAHNESMGGDGGAEMPPARRALVAAPGNFYMYQSVRHQMRADALNPPSAAALQQASAAAMAALSAAPASVPRAAVYTPAAGPIVPTGPIDPMVPFDGGYSQPIYGANPMLPPTALTAAPMMGGYPQMPAAAAMGYYRPAVVMAAAPAPAVMAPPVYTLQPQHVVTPTYAPVSPAMPARSPAVEMPPSAARSKHNVIEEC